MLAAIGLLGGESSFENISAIVNEWSSIDVESRFVYAAMDRLQDRKLITSHFSDVAKTGNAPKRLFKITPDGQRKLSTAPKQALARVKTTNGTRRMIQHGAHHSNRGRVVLFIASTGAEELVPGTVANMHDFHFL